MTVLLLPEPGPERTQFVDAQLGIARQAQVDGDRDRAIQTLVESIRAGLWSHSRLWSEVLSLMWRRPDYPLFRSLWLESPRRCQRDRSIIRIVATAAWAAGEQTEARGLLRKAILRESRRQRRLRLRLRRGRRRIAAQLGRWLWLGYDRRRATRRRTTALMDLTRELSERGGRPFLVAGSLRGYVRHGSLIPDSDHRLQVGTILDAPATASLERDFDRSPVFQVIRPDPAAGQLRLKHCNGVLIDISLHHLAADGRLWHGGPAARWWHAPFEVAPSDLAGAAYFVPDPPERYLTESYGDWLELPVSYDPWLDAPNVEVTDSELFDTWLYFSLLEAISRNRYDHARRLVGLLQERGEGSWLGRVMPAPRSWWG